MRPRNRSRRLALAHALVVVGALAWASTAPAAPADADAIAANGLPPGVPACQTCHGAKGEGIVAAGFPRLAGSGRGYLAQQLASFASGQRQSPVMQPIAAALSAGQQAALASYYAGLGEAHPTAEAVDPLPAQAGAWLASRGRWAADIPACAQCHGVRGLGIGDAFPPLAGQPANYLSAQLQSWKHGTRPPGPQSLMAAIAARLSDADIAAVADYYAGLPADGAAAQASQGARP